MSSLLSKKYVDGIYIPSGLLVLGCLIVKREWVPYAVVLAAVISGYKLWSGNSKNNIRPLRFSQGPREYATNNIFRCPKGPQTY
jgi:cytochrome-b5 reductase